MTDLRSISSLPSDSLSQFRRSVELLRGQKPTHALVQYERSDHIAGALFDIHTVLVLQIPEKAGTGLKTERGSALEAFAALV